MKQINNVLNTAETNPNNNKERMLADEDGEPIPIPPKSHNNNGIYLN